MIYIQNEIPEKVGYLIPIGDLHFGDRAFKKRSLDKLKGYVSWVKKKKNSRVVLGGDMFNVATRVSKTTPWSQRMSLDEELEEVIKILKPVKTQIIGAIEGNHEERLLDYVNYSPTITLCKELDTKYMGFSGVVVFRVNKYNPREPKRGEYQENYKVYFHHTTGGGGTAGAGINRIEKLKNIVEGCDAYCGFHNHGIGAKPQEVFFPNMRNKTLDKRRYWLVSCGSYLEYADSYAEKGMLTPQKLGSPRIRFDGCKHDLHISL